MNGNLMAPLLPGSYSSIVVSSESKIMNVGFIGLGRMGSGMATNLLRAGHRVTVYNRTPEKAETLSAQGATVATRVAGACRGDAVITMLANDAAVESVVLGRDGVVASVPAGALHVPPRAPAGRLAMTPSRPSTTLSTAASFAN